MSHYLFLLRHAKSDWNINVGDHERPLSKRGRNSASAIGHWMQQQQLIPEKIIVSTAERAMQTCLYLQEGLHNMLDTPDQSRELYLADSETMLDIIAEQDDRTQSLMLIGHNPGMDELLSYLCGGDLPYTDNGKLMTTATLAVIELENGWNHINAAENSLIELVRPRELANSR